VVVDAGALAGSLAPDPEHAWLPYSVLEGRPHSGGPAPLLTTADGGVTWTQLALPAGLSPNLHAHRTFQLATPEVGYAVAEPAEGFGARSEPPTFFRTDDGGRTFTQFLPLLV
jgi:photosystem II stability/assembly factor-like uncharacterized protein